MGFFAKIKEGLKKTRDKMSSSVESMLNSFTVIDESLFEELEELLVMGDVGVPTSEHICEALRKKVKEKGVTDPTGFQLADFLIGAAGQGKSKVETAEDDALACPACGFTQADFKKTGRLGCPVCYDTFAEGLSGLLKAMHRRTTHTGKIPARLKRSIEMGARVSQLKRDLDKAVMEENYENAAEIRDQLKELEQIK